MKRLIVLLCVVFFVVSIFGAEAVTDLSSWSGVNVSTTAVLNGVRLNEYCNAIAEYKEGYTGTMVKAFVEKMFYTTFMEFEVLSDGKTVVFDNYLEAEYYYLGSLSTTWQGNDITWIIFKTDSTEAIANNYKYLLLFPFHGHADGLQHMHMRYGNENFDFLTTDPSLTNWWPTCYRENELDKDTFFEEQMSAAKMMSTMLPDIAK